MARTFLKTLLFLASFSFAAVPCAHALDSSTWRDYYAKAYSVEFLKTVAKAALNNYTSTSPSISGALLLAKDGKGHEAVGKLLGSPDEESVFVKALIYEAIGFYPEASGNYTRLVQFYPNGKLFRRAVIRNAFLKLIKGVHLDSMSLVKEASHDFYMVYKESDEPIEWKDAMAGYAITLSIIKEESYADEVFKKIDSHVSLNPAYQIFRAENYFKQGRLTESKAVFQKLIDSQSGFKSLPYLKLRMGDISVLEGRDNVAEPLYREILEFTKDNFDARTGQTPDTVVMGTMALAELYMKKNKNEQAVKLLKDFAEKHPKTPVSDSANYFLIKLLRTEGGFNEAATLSNKFLAVYQLSAWKQEVNAIRDDIILTSITAAYKNMDYKKVASLYYENKPFFIKDELLMAMAGESFLHLNLPKEAEEVYKLIKKGKGLMGSLGLAKSFIMNGSPQKAIDIMKGLSPIKNEERIEAAAVFYMLGDFYFRAGKYEDAIKQYYLAQKNGMKGLDLLFKTGSIYGLLGRNDDALKVFENVLLKAKDSQAKAKALVKMGDVYYASKRWEEALSSYEKGIQFMEKDVERAQIVYKIGEASINIGKKRDAVTAWQEVERDDKGYLGRLASERIKEVRTWETLKM